jgi:hypothetical protein
MPARGCIKGVRRLGRATSLTCSSRTGGSWSSTWGALQASSLPRIAGPPCRRSRPRSQTCELAYLSRTPVAELERALLRTRAFVSLLRCTGMRSITAMNVRTPHLLAGRSGRDDPPHPMWQCLAQDPGDE